MKLLLVLFIAVRALVSSELIIPSDNPYLDVEVKNLEFLNSYPLETIFQLQTKLGKKFRESLDEIIPKIEDAIEHGNTIKEEDQMKIKELKDKLKDIKDEIAYRLKKLLKIHKKLAVDQRKEYLKSTDFRYVSIFLKLFTFKYDDFAQDLKNKFDDHIKNIMNVLENGKNLKDCLEKLKELYKDLKEMKDSVGENGKKLFDSAMFNSFKKLDEKYTGKGIKGVIELIKRKEREQFKKCAKFEEVLDGDFLEQLVEKVKGKGDRWQKKILEIVDKVLEDQEGKRPIEKVYEKIKNYFKDLQIDLKEKFMKFGEWAKTKYEEGLVKSKDKVENLKTLAKEFINDTKVLSKDLAEQAKEFFKKYEDDLGSVYDDVCKRVKDILES